MKVDWQIVGDVIVPFVTLVLGFVLNRALESRPNVISYLGHVGSHRVKRDDDSEYFVYTHSIIVRNAGRRPAKNVRVSHVYLPPNVNVLPDTKYSIERTPGGGADIVFPALVPNEQVTISYLYFPPITWGQIVGTVKSDEGLAKIISVLPAQQYPTWVLRLLQALTLLGGGTVLYLISLGVRKMIAAAA